MPRLPDLEAWVLFAKVAQTSSFTRAADELGISKATVSKAIARLEARIGMSLLNRTSRSLSLTEAGRHMATSAARILAEGEILEAEAMAQAVAPHGLVRLTAPMSFGLAHVAPILPELFQTYPDVSIDLHLADEVVDLVAGGFDIALRIAALPDSTLRARRICQIRRLLVGAPEYFERLGRPQHPDDLAEHACLGYAYLPTQDRWRFIRATGEEVSVTPRSQLRANNADALRPMLLAGMGLAVQPEFLTSEDLEAGRLEIAMSDWSMPPIALNIVTPPGNFRPACVTAVIEFLLRRFAGAPWARAEGP
ncbi:MAG TPA: LysR family transcriptional regulator [Acidocella sp.]|jgi:DNA-binding transcriptional LysR family regulator|uniref:LysR family transcriptional regulator n=1 Tax=Acidocella sp. TaxID=50710 RepID=UPI002C209B57|nr:LysR family transcriptional regulator [Acidocella sp.]HVE22350.1 LysR family transcriptional regulator [Acidocella sp.]